jgi:hypothetical protein
MRLANMRNEAFSGQVSTIEDIPNLRVGHSSYAYIYGHAIRSINRYHHLILCTNVLDHVTFGILVKS